MRSLRVKAAGTLLILLALSIELTPRLLFPRTLAQQEGYEDFLSRLENYLNNALPSESDPIKECEYIVPEGFNASYAERLWRFFASNVSRGCSEQDFRRALGSIYPNGTIPVEVNGSMVTLNFTGLRVEKPSDGSVKIRIPLVSNETLSYTYFNSTSVRIIYETWNETLVRYYRVKSLLPFLNVTYRSLDDNSTITRLIKPFLNTSVMLGNQTVTQGLSMEVTVPEHQQEILTLVPEHTEALRILFPAYTIRIIVFRNLTLPPGSNWEIEGEGSWWDVPVGNNFTIYYYVDWFHVDPEDEPLNAVLRVKPSSGFQAIGQDSARLTNSQPFGMFFLKATEKGLHNITLTLEGNAVFTDGSRETSVSIRIVGQEFPSISVSILNVDVSKPGCVRLGMSLRNTGGSRATSVRFLPVWHEWRDNPLQATGHIRNPIDLPDLEPGETYFFSYTYQVRHQHIIVFPDVWYVHRAPPAGTYWFRSLTWVPLNYTPPSPAGPAGEEYEEHVIAVPEHFEEEFVFIPARFAGMNVTIPGYRRYVHISMQGVGVSVFEAMLRGLMNGVNGTVIPLLLGENLTYGVFAPLALSSPLLGLELSMGEQVEGEARYVMQSVERLFTDHGVLNETTVCGMLNVTREDLRHGRIPGEYNATLLCETWVKSRSLLMNASLFASYNLTVSKYIRDTGLQGELRIRWQRLTDASRFSKPSGETGFLTLIYRPLTVKGDGPLKSVQVRNYAGFNACYRLRVFRYDVAGFPAPVGQTLQPLWENFSSPFEVKRLSDTVILASSLAPTGQAYSVQLLYGSGIVAEAFFTLGVEQSPFWTGFWDGIKEKAWGIILTTAILVVLAIPTGGGTLLAEAKAYLTSTLIPQMMAASAAVNLIEIVEAYWAYDRLGKVAEALDGFSQKASNNGYVNASLFFRSLGDRVREGRMLIAENTALDLLADLTVRDLFIVFGKGDATEYEKGRAWGRVVGTALSFLVYAYTYYRLFTDGPRLLSWRGKIKSFLRGVYNWVTPPLWDFGVALGSFAVDRVAASLYLSEQNQRFKEYLNLIREDEASLSRVVEFTNGYLENALKISEGLGLSEKAFLGLLWAYGNTAKDLREEDWSRFLTEIQDIGGDSRRFADELLRWLYNAEDPLKIEQAVLEVTPRLADLSAGELENMGKALAKVGDSFENGVKLFDTYFKTVEQYDKSIANAFLEAVSKNMEVLGLWKNAIDKGFKVLVDIGTCGENDLSVKGKTPIGYQWIQVISEDSGKIVDETLRNISPEQETIYLKGVKAGEKHILIFMDINTDNFLEYVKVRDVMGKYGKAMGEWLRDEYGLPAFSFTKEGGDTYLVIGGEKVAKVEVNLGGGINIIYLEFKALDLNGKTHSFHIEWKDGDPGFSILLGEHPYPVKEFAQKVVKKEGNIIARLVSVEYSKAGGQSAIFPTARAEFSWAFVNAFSTDEGIIDIQGSAIRLEDILKDIFGDEMVSELKSDKARVALIYKHGEEVRVMLANPTDLKVSDLPEGSKALGLLVLKMDERLSTDIEGDTVISLGGNVIRKERTYLMDLTISKGSYSKTLQTRVTFWNEPSAWMKAKVGDLELIYKLGYDEETGTATCEPLLKIGESEIRLSDMEKFVLLSDVKYLGDIAYIRAGTNEEIISLSENPPKGFGDFKRRPKHAWYVASYLQHEFEKTYTSWDIEKVEYEYNGNWFDVVVIKPSGRKAILEFKTIYDARESEELIKQAVRYIEACIRDQNFEEVHYLFQVDQNNEVPQEGMKGLYRALNEFLNTGKLKQPDGTVLLDMDLKEANKILKVLTWAGGYLP